MSTIEQQQPEPQEQAPDVERKEEAPLGVPGDNGATPLFMIALVSFMVTVITAGGMLMGYDHFLAKKFVVVDVNGYVEAQQELYLAGKLTDEQLKQSYATLKEAVARIPANRVVLMGDAVLGGVERLEITATPK